MRQFFTKKQKIDIVKRVVSGELRVEEAISAYHIGRKQTLINWIRQFHQEVQNVDVLAMLDKTAEQKVNKRTVLKFKEIEGLYADIIDIYKRLDKLESQREVFMEESYMLVLQLKELRIKIDLLSQ